MRVLEFFGYKDQADFAGQMKPFEQLEEVAVEAEVKDTCVACGVSENELHIFGCPVEQCPWCDGQLSRCNCRFDQLDVDEIEEQEQLDRFETILDVKGRVPFTCEQNPSYPTAGNDPAPGELKK